MLSSGSAERNGARLDKPDLAGGPELVVRGKVVLFSSHELDTVERVCAHVVILHRGRVVADDSIEHLRTLMAAPTLEDVFAQLAVGRRTC